MNLSLWIIAGLLAVVFLTGSAKLLVPKEKLAPNPAKTEALADSRSGV